MQSSCRWACLPLCWIDFLSSCPRAPKSDDLLPLLTATRVMVRSSRCAFSNDVGRISALADRARSIVRTLCRDAWCVLSWQGGGACLWGTRVCLGSRVTGCVGTRQEGCDRREFVRGRVCVPTVSLASAACPTFGGGYLGGEVPFFQLQLKLYSACDVYMFATTRVRCCSKYEEKMACLSRQQHRASVRYRTTPQHPFRIPQPIANS